jgi:ureidoglycolate dehydrogenase (NAD+)
MSVEYKHYSFETLTRFIKEVFLAAGVRPDVAQYVTEGLCITSLRGVDSHGVRLMPHYVRALEGGRINPDPAFEFRQTSPSTGVLDADHTYGHAAGRVGMQHAIELARNAGVGMVAVKHSSHCGAMACYGLEPPKHDMIGLAFTHATSKVRTPGSSLPFVGTNPLCMTAPMLSEEPYCFDAAPTPITSNRLKQYREDGELLPAGSAADADGQETRDADDAVMLLPIGDYKGFGWAMMVDILCGLLTGMPVGQDISNMYGDPISKKRDLGHFFGAIRIDTFEDPQVFKQRLQDMAEQVRALPRRHPDKPVMVAGDPEKRAKSERLAHGIPIKPIELQQFEEVANRLQITPLTARQGVG